MSFPDPVQASNAIAACVNAYLCTVGRKPGEILHGHRPLDGRMDRCCLGLLGVSFQGARRTSESTLGGCDDEWEGTFEVQYRTCMSSFDKVANGDAVDAAEQNAGWKSLTEAMWATAQSLTCCFNDSGSLLWRAGTVDSVSPVGVAAECAGFNIGLSIDLGVCCP